MVLLACDHNMNLFVIILFYFIFCTIELFFAYTENERLRKLFKCLPLFMLFLGALISEPNNYLLYLPFLFYVIGDAFLLSMQKKYFVYGTICFLIGHLITTINVQVDSIIYLYEHLFIQFAALIVGCVLILIFLRKHLKKDTLSGGIYFGTLLGNSVLTFIIGYLNSNPVYYCLALGFALYFFSDLMVVYKRFYHRVKRDDFYIMSSYYLAVFFVFLGLFLF